MTKIFSFFISAIVLLSVCIIAAFPTSAEDVDWEAWLFDGQGELIGYYGDDANVTVPMEDQNGVPTVSLGDEAFKGNTDITSVVIPEGIEKMGNKCFEGCKNLSEVSLPYSLEDAGQYSTFGSTALTSITVPGNVVKIPSSFFAAEEVQLTDFIITPGVQEIAAKALWTSGLDEVVIPKSVEVIGWGFIMDGSPSNKDPLKIYVLNPQAVMGVASAEDEAFERIIGGDASNGGPIVRCSQGRRSQIYGVGDDNTVKAHVEKHLSSRNGFYFSVDQEKADELEAELKEKGIQKPVVTEKPTDTDNGSDTDNADDADKDDSDKDSDKSTDNSDSSLDLTIIIIAVCVVLVVIIIAAVVIVLVVMNGKKKKKKAKKAAKAAKEAPVEEASAEEANEE